MKKTQELKPDGGPARDISLRAWIAGRALTGILAANANPTSRSIPDPDVAARIACDYADALLIELSTMRSGVMASRDCPRCGSPETDIVRPVNPDRQFGPGERAVYRCTDCARIFDAIVPEPPDDYQGDGIFAENH